MQVRGTPNGKHRSLLLRTTLLTYVFFISKVRSVGPFSPLIFVIASDVQRQNFCTDRIGESESHSSDGERDLETLIAIIQR